MTVTVLPFRTHPIVSTALRLARDWCAGHRIDDAPALAHAVRVAALLGRHAPGTPELVAAALLHDSPEFAPAAGVDDLDAVLSENVSGEVARIVRALEREHQALDEHGAAHPPIHDVPVLLASAADKVVSLTSVLGRAGAARDPATYWAQRSAFLRNVPYFRGFYQAAAPHLPPALADALHNVVARAELVTKQYTFADQGSDSMSRSATRERS